MSFDSVKNFVKVKVSTGYDQAATSITLHGGDGSSLPAAPFNLVWWNSTDYADPTDDPNVEIVRVTGVSGDVLTITRAQESTNASVKNLGGRVYKMLLGPTAKTITDIENAISAIPGATSMKVINVSGSTPGTSFTASSAHTGSSIIINSNTVFVEGTDYTCSGTSVTWLYYLPSQYSGTMIMICVG